MVRTYTNPGAIILDNTSGSGSFVVAALAEGRNFVAIEKNENVSLFKKGDIDYIQATEERLKAAWEKLSAEKKAYITISNLIASFENGTI